MCTEMFNLRVIAEGVRKRFICELWLKASGNVLFVSYSRKGMGNMQFFSYS
jgi:hypothetical protein